MEDKTNILDTVTLNAEEIKARAEEEEKEVRKLEIFGEGEGALAKDGGVKYVKPKALYVVICILAGVLLGVALTLALVSKISGGLANLRLIKNMGEYDSSVISELLQRIDAYHFGETPESKTLVEKASHALVDAVGDPYAAYFTDEEYEAYTNNFNGNYYGIGILVQNPDGTGALIRRVYEGSFAEKAGLLAKDVIIAVDGKDITSSSSNDLVSLITGEEGSKVSITVRRGDEEKTFEVERGAVYVKRVETMTIGDIGYLYLSSFSGNAENEFRDAIEGFINAGIKRVVVDLRDDPGGSLSIVVNICDMLLPKCTIVSMRGNTTDPTRYFESNADMYDIDFVVLVNEYSASASEIFAGAMQDNGRAKIIGTQTYGKGVVQTTVRLDAGHGWLKLTTDAYYTPNGTNLGGTGITPDIVVDLPDELKAYDIFTLYTEHLEEDTQLQAAIRELTSAN
ncbi:MAG: S41 family peptidase [Clostridiales bacterium]|nr:S41 family peptidase [Clostridiales bacterium]